MDIKKLQNTVISALEDVKAQDIRVYDTVHLTSLFDRIAIASGTSNRQTKALAASVRDQVKEHGGTVYSIEGEQTGEWVLVDLGDMVVHIMQPAIRAYYRLEEIWGDKEVKLGAANRLPKRAAATEGAAAPKKAARHLTITQGVSDEAPKKRAAKKAAGGTTAAASGKAAAASNAAPKTGARKPAASKTGTRTAKAAGPATAVTPVKKTATRRAPAKAKSAE
ncbi:MAG: ribosome silencing factor [Gallionellales bacterium RBG_16_56_9]|nr:MAG: ribosome silencing factor [Gallionellales bacterium RBG_16_56_9]